MNITSFKMSHKMTTLFAQRLTYLVAAASLLLERNDLLNTHGRLDGNLDLILPIRPSITDSLGHISWVRRQVDVGLLIATLVHEGQLPLLADVDDFPLGAGDDGDGRAVGSGHHIFKFLPGEDVGGGEVAFGVAVFAGLRDGDV